MTKLSSLKTGDAATIINIEAENDEKRRLASLGIVECAKIRIHKKGNPLLLNIAGTSITLSQSLAKKIFVKKEQADSTQKNIVKKETTNQTFLLVGNPNVGKSQVFTKLTGVKAISSNFPGTTVKIKKGQASFNNFLCTIIDIPGIYRLDNNNKAEQEASNMIKGEDYDLILCILEATHLERSLFLALEILSLEKPVIFILNKCETAKTNGININIQKLSEILSAPVVEVEAFTGYGFYKIEEVVGKYIKEKALEKDICHETFKAITDNRRWEMIGNIIQDTQSLEHRHPTFIEKLADLCTKPFEGLIIAALVLISSFFIVRFVGEGLIGLLTPLFENHYVPYITGLFGNNSDTWWGIFLLGQGEETFGILTTALQIALIDVMSYVLIFYAVFEFLADLGYLPRLAVLLDSTLHKLGLHGYGVIPILMGMGCKVPAVMSVRTLESKREKFIALILIMMLVPCISQSAMIFQVFDGYSFGYVILVFAILAVTGILAGFLLNKIMKGNPTEMFMEIPSWQLPKFNHWITKVWYRLKFYILEAIPMIILGICLINIADQTGVLKLIANAMYFPVEKMMGLPAETSSVIILGFLRKDVSIALLSPFNLTAAQLTVACVFMTMYLPCVATFFVMIKEFGIKVTAKISLFTIVIALLLACIIGLIMY